MAEGLGDLVHLLLQVHRDYRFLGIFIVALQHKEPATVQECPRGFAIFDGIACRWIRVRSALILPLYSPKARDS